MSVGLLAFAAAVRPPAPVALSGRPAIGAGAGAVQWSRGLAGPGSLIGVVAGRAGRLQLTVAGQMIWQSRWQ